jgi:site-specific DNA-methyltransferase (adenine-specific)
MAITQLTALTTRRSVYCSKRANGKHSIATIFNDEEGCIWFKRTEHTWTGGTQKVITVDEDGKEIEKKLGGKCKHCGASQSEYERDKTLESHAYALIHTEDPKQLIKEVFGEEMQFDVIIGNPPYQLSVGNTEGNSSKARAIYHEFVSQAIKLDPRFIALVIPSRWMTRSTEGIPDTWIDDFIDDRRVKILHDYLDSRHSFPGVNITGGICYFLWDNLYDGKCDYYLHSGEADSKILHHHDFLNAKGLGIVIRDIEAIPILDKIDRVSPGWWVGVNENFSGLVSPKDFFTNKTQLTSSWTGFSGEKSRSHTIKYYLNKSMHKLDFGWVQLEDIPKNHQSINIHKVFIPAARGTDNEDDNLVLGQPFYGESNSVCSQTYLVIGFDPKIHNFSKAECENIISYISTKFFRYLVSLKKKTQNGPRQVYQFVPIQDFSHKWTDEMLFKKYDLSDKEIEIINGKIRVMEIKGE